MSDEELVEAVDKNLPAGWSQVAERSALRGKIGEAMLRQAGGRRR